MTSKETIRVFFPLLDKTIEIEEGATVAEACAKVGLPQNLVCGGNGKCLKCLVSIRENASESEVLSCKHLVSPDMQVLVSHETALSQILETTGKQSFVLNPRTKVITIPTSDLKTEMCSFDLETIRKALDLPLRMLSIRILKKVTTLFHQKECSAIHFILFDDQIIDLIPSDDAPNVYGVAFDIGTTSVVGYLYNLTTGALINQHSTINGQIRFGGDVISRIEYASASPENLQSIHDAILETTNDILNQLCEKSNITPDLIYDTVFCGNSTMQRLFLGLNPYYLGISPFTGVSGDIFTSNADELGLGVNPLGKFSFLPLLGGFVGADTSSVLLSLPNDDHLRLMIDLGTNGEIAVGNDNKYFVASCACGPALEGAGIHLGMRGTIGAIQKIELQNDEILCDVIGGVDPIGFCGSGIIDAIAFLYREKVIYDRGNFVKGKDLENHPLKDRITKDEDGQRCFIFVRKEDNPSGREMIITQKDVRAVQLAKAAIYTGCCMLIEKFGLKGEELKEIVLSGAFGNYIDIENAQYIGLLPDISGVPIRSIGNGAGTGSQLFLLSNEEIKRCENLPCVTTHIELASDPNFSNLYMQYTNLGSAAK